MKKLIILFGLAIISFVAIPLVLAVTCESPYVEYEGVCTDPIPACENPPAHSVPSTCIDKIEDGVYIENYSFECEEGYSIEGNLCVCDSECLVCESPYVEYDGECVDPIPACENPPEHSVPSTCIDKIEDGVLTSNYSFSCEEGYVRSENECVLIDNFVTEQTSTVSIPPAGFEDEVLVNIEAYENPFPDTNIAYIEGQAAAELYRRAIIGGYPDGEFKGSREVNRAEAAKFLLLARYESVEDMENNGQFPDVVEGQWYVSYIVKAADLGIIIGYSDGNFRPQNTVNTAEFLKMFTLTFGLDTDLEYSYEDVDSEDWFAQYVGIAEEYDLLPNRGVNLEPARLMTRGCHLSISEKSIIMIKQ